MYNALFKLEIRIKNYVWSGQNFYRRINDPELFKILLSIELIPSHKKSQHRGVSTKWNIKKNYIAKRLRQSLLQMPETF